MARNLAAYATCAALGGAGAGVLGYGGLRLLQEWLGFPELAPALLAVTGAVAGCVLGLRLVPAGWFPHEAEAGAAPPASARTRRPTR